MFRFNTDVINEVFSSYLLTLQISEQPCKLTPKSSNHPHLPPLSVGLVTSTRLGAFPGLHTPALGEVGVSALCFPPAPHHRHTWPWVLACCPCSVTPLARCCLLPVFEGKAAHPGSVR